MLLSFARSVRRPTYPGAGCGALRNSKPPASADPSSHCFALLNNRSNADSSICERPTTPSDLNPAITVSSNHGVEQSRCRAITVSSDHSKKSVW